MDRGDLDALDLVDDWDGAVDNLVGILSGVDRRGYWQPAGQVNVYVFMGGARLDFRDAGLLEGTTVIDVYACMGGAMLIFPPDVEIETRGNGFMGGFSHVAQHTDDPSDPRVVVRGFACMGGVEIKICDPFEPLDDEDDPDE